MSGAASLAYSMKMDGWSSRRRHRGRQRLSRRHSCLSPGQVGKLLHCNLQIIPLTYAVLERVKLREASNWTVWDEIKHGTAAEDRKRAFRAGMASVATHSVASLAARESESRALIVELAAIEMKVRSLSLSAISISLLQ